MGVNAVSPKQYLLGGNGQDLDWSLPVEEILNVVEAQLTEELGPPGDWYWDGAETFWFSVWKKNRPGAWCRACGFHPDTAPGTWCCGEPTGAWRPRGDV